MAMRVKCPKCSAQYNLDPQKLSPQGTKVRCSSCQHIFVVKRKADGAETSVPPGASVPPAGKARSDEDPIHGGASSAPKSSSIMDDHPIPMNDSSSDESPASRPNYKETLHDLGKVPPAAAAPKPAAAPAPAPAKPAPAPAAKPAAAPAAAPKPPAPAPAAKPGAMVDSGAKWRVKKQGLGLIYGPADLNTVQSWIQNERINSKDAYSRDGSDWAGPEMFVEVAPLLGLKPAPDAIAPGAAPVAPKPAPAPSFDTAAESLKMSPPVPQEPRKPATLGFELDHIEEEAAHEPKGGSLMLTAVIGLVLLVLAAGGVFYFVVLPNDEMIDRFYAGPARSIVEPLVRAMRPDYKSADERDAERIARNQALQKQAEVQQQAAQEKRPYADGYVPAGESQATEPIRQALKQILADTDEAYSGAVKSLEPVAAAEGAPPEAKALLGMVKALQALSKGDESYADTALNSVASVAQIATYPLGNRTAFITGLLLAKRFTEAQKAAAEESQRNPSDPFLHYLFGLSKLSDPKGMDEYRKVLEIEPGFLAAKVEIANRLVVSATDVQEAEKQVREVIAAAPSHKRARSVADSIGIKDLPPDPTADTVPPKLTDKEVQDLFIRTEQQVKDQKLDEATKSLERLITVYRPQLSPMLRGSAHYYRGEMYRIAGDRNAALGQYETALIENPKENRAKKAIDKLKAEAVPAPAASQAAPAMPAPVAAPAAAPAAPVKPAVPAATVPAPVEKPVAPAAVKVPEKPAEPAPPPPAPAAAEKPAAPAAAEKAPEPPRPAGVPPPATDLPPPPSE